MEAEGKAVVEVADNGLGRLVVIGQRRIGHAGPKVQLKIRAVCDGCQYFAVAKGLNVPNRCARQNRDTAEMQTNHTPAWCPFADYATADMALLAHGIADEAARARMFAVRISVTHAGLHPSEAIVSFIMVPSEDMGEADDVLPALVSTDRRNIVDGQWLTAGFIRRSDDGLRVLAEFPNDISPGLSRRAWVPVRYVRNIPRTL